MPKSQETTKPKLQTNMKGTKTTTHSITDAKEHKTTSKRGREAPPAVPKVSSRAQAEDSGGHAAGKRRREGPAPIEGATDGFGRPGASDAQQDRQPKDGKSKCPQGRRKAQCKDWEHVRATAHEEPV
jgi:hypothetical protein